jgi:hypothetical protein
MRESADLEQDERSESLKCKSDFFEIAWRACSAFKCPPLAYFLASVRLCVCASKSAASLDRFVSSLMRTHDCRVVDDRKIGSRADRSTSCHKTSLHNYCLWSLFILPNLFFTNRTMPVKLGVNGFGRIGRLVTRAALDNPDATVVAVNDPFLTIDYAVYQLQHDSVHGLYPKMITVDGDFIVVGDTRIRFFSERNPAGKPSKIMLLFCKLTFCGLIPLTCYFLYSTLQTFPGAL